MREILRNFPHNEAHSGDSFLGILHKQEYWSVEEYWKLEKDLYVTAEKYSGDIIPRNVAWPIARIFSFTMLSLMSHRDPDDLYTIKNLDRDDTRDWRERVQIVFEGFFSGEMYSLDLFDEKNPLF